VRRALRHINFIHAAHDMFNFVRVVDVRTLKLVCEKKAIIQIILYLTS